MIDSIVEDWQFWYAVLKDRSYDSLHCWRINDFDILHNRIWSVISILEQLSRTGITEEEDIPDDVVIEDVEERSQSSISISDQASETHIDEFPINNDAPENEDFLSEDDNEDYIEQIATGLFVQDTMMYKPFRIIPPSPYRSSYFFRLDTWFRGMLRPNVWNESTKRFVLRCLEDLRNWNNDDTGYKLIEENDQMEQFFEEWPARIQTFEERMQQVVDGKNTV